MTTKMFQASIGQKVTFPIGPEEYVTGTVKVRSLDSFRRVMLIVECDSGARYVVFEFYARPYDDTAERQEAVRLAGQHAKAEQERQRQAREEAKLFEDAERAMAKQAQEKAEADKRATKLLADAERSMVKQAVKEQKEAAKRAAKDEKEAAKRAEQEAKEAQKEAAELTERALIAEAEERVSRLTFVDPLAGWTQRVVNGETKRRSTATRAVIGTAILPGIGTAIGFMAKKNSDSVYLETLNADGALMRSERGTPATAGMLRFSASVYNKLHAVGPDGTTAQQRSDRIKELKRQVKLLRKQGS